MKINRPYINCVVLKGYPELYLFIFCFDKYRIGKEQQKEATGHVLGYLSITPVRNTHYGLLHLEYCKVKHI